MKTIEQVLPELIASVKQSQLVLFAGSGISVAEPSRLPTWDQFLKGFIQFCHDLARQVNDKDFDTVLAQAEKNSERYPARVASVLKGWLKEMEQKTTFSAEALLQQWFISQFVGRLHNKNHEYIAATDYPFILTSNYDTLIEDAARARNLNSLALRSYTFSDVDKIASAVFQKKSCIMHVHGLASGITLDRVVFTSEDYINMIKRKYPGFTFSIQTIFWTYSTLFVGYGMSDPHLEDLIEEISYFLNYSQMKDLPKIYVVVKKKGSEEFLDRYKKRMRTEIVVVSSWDEQTHLLRELQDANKRGNVDLSESLFDKL